MHVIDKDEIIRLELPALAMSFRNYVPCVSGTDRCLPRNTHCTANGFFVTTEDCTKLSGLHIVGPKSLIKPFQIPAGRLVSNPVLTSLQLY